jgi:cytoskeleton protein RodZ
MEAEERKKTVGEILRAERAKKKLSLDEVAFKTKISKRLVKCMEENKFSELPSAVAIKGFLKIYCEFLELPFEPLVNELKEQNILDRGPAIKLARSIETNAGVVENPANLRYGMYAASGFAVLLVLIILLVFAASCQRKESAHVKKAAPIVVTSIVVPRTIVTTGEQ